VKGSWGLQGRTISSEETNEILAVLTSNIVSCRLEGDITSRICSGDGAQVISSSGGSSGDKLVVVRGELAIEPAPSLGYPSVMPCQRGHLVNERRGIRNK
jgi:hypothetical protein